MTMIRETFNEVDHPSQSDDTLQIQYKSPDSLVQQNMAINGALDESDSQSETTQKNDQGLNGAFEKYKTSFDAQDEAVDVSAVEQSEEEEKKEEVENPRQISKSTAK